MENRKATGNRNRYCAGLTTRLDKHEGTQIHSHTRQLTKSNCDKEQRWRLLPGSQPASPSTTARRRPYRLRKEETMSNRPGPATHAAGRGGTATGKRKLGCTHSSDWLDCASVSAAVMMRAFPDGQASWWVDQGALRCKVALPSEVSSEGSLEFLCHACSYRKSFSRNGNSATASVHGFGARIQ
jgi:hypothetical protein